MIFYANDDEFVLNSSSFIGIIENDDGTNTFIINQSDVASNVGTYNIDVRVVCDSYPTNLQGNYYY